MHLKIVSAIHNHIRYNVSTCPYCYNAITNGGIDAIAVITEKIITEKPLLAQLIQRVSFHDMNIETANAVMKDIQTNSIYGAHITTHEKRFSMCWQFIVHIQDLDELQHIFKKYQLEGATKEAEFAMRKAEMNSE